MAAKKNEPEKLQKAVEKLKKRYIKKSFVTGVDHGYRWKDGVRTDEIVVRVHVREKKPESLLQEGEAIPKTIDGIQIDVYEGEYRVQYSGSSMGHQSRLSPLQAGGSLSNGLENAAGTLGAFVADDANGRVGVLSNWHVLVGPKGARGTQVVQPGLLDGGSSNRDVIGQVERWMLDGDGDAAFAPIDGARSWIPKILGAASYPDTVGEAQVGDTVGKSGRTTANTSGLVDGMGTYKIGYETAPGVFTSIAIKGFKIVPKTIDNSELSAGGDSGACWIDEDGKTAVGLHVAGETDTDPMAEHAIACNLEAVMRRLGLRLASASDVQSLISQEDSFDNSARYTVADIIEAYERGRSAPITSWESAEPSFQPSRFERASSKRISDLEIERRVRAALKDLLGRSVQFFWSTKLSVVWPTTDGVVRFANDLLYHPPFRRDGLSLNPNDAQFASTFGDLIDLVFQSYTKNGWVIFEEDRG